MIADTAHVPEIPKPSGKDAQAIAAAGADLGNRAVELGKDLAAASPLAGTVLANRAEKGAAALARIVGKFFPGLLNAGGGGLLALDLVTVLTSLAAVGVAALVDVGKLPPDHRAAQRLGVTELAAALAQREQTMAAQLAGGAAGVPGAPQLTPAQFEWLQNQQAYQAQAAAVAYQQQLAAAQAAAAAQRQQAAQVNAAAGLGYPAYLG